MAVADDSSSDADDKQEQQYEARLQKAPDLKNNRIEVDVDDGIAVLEGTVDSARERKEAQQLGHVGGILGVNNRLSIPAPEIAPAGMSTRPNARRCSPGSCTTRSTPNWLRLGSVRATSVRH